MPLRIISADERLANSHLRGSVFVGGPWKVGKTSLLFSLPPEATLALDFEGGFKSVETWGGDVIEIRDFVDGVDIGCLVGGVDPSSGPNDMFSKEHFAAVTKTYPEIAAKMDQYKFVFFDSVSRLSFAAAKFAKQQPESFTDKGKFDRWGMYGLIASNMITLLNHMQHSRKNVIFIGLLEDAEDEFGRHHWRIQLEGAKTARELPGIVDQVVTMQIFSFDEATGVWTPDPNGKHRAFVCHRANPWGYPAGTRSVGNVDMIEEPHLGRLIEKLNAPAKLSQAKG
jgi:hypothetical protein